MGSVLTVVILELYFEPKASQISSDILILEAIKATEQTNDMLALEKLYQSKLYNNGKIYLPYVVHKELATVYQRNGLRDWAITEYENALSILQNYNTPIEISERDTIERNLSKLKKRDGP